ncbi:hypothetical protein TNCV_1101361 [Trichonephila clavipes]|nr:hypothetical protein TNCV_1101361 [Trichonephila clavipes]
MATKPYPKTGRTQATKKKVKSLVLKENPPTQRFIISKLGMSSGNIRKIAIKENQFSFAQLTEAAVRNGFVSAQKSSQKDLR